MEIGAAIFGLAVEMLTWIEDKARKYDSVKTGFRHIDHLNARQRFVLDEICRAYSETPIPITSRRIFSDLWMASMREYGQPQDMPADEIQDMLDDLVSRALMDRTPKTYTPTKRLLKYVEKSN